MDGFDIDVDPGTVALVGDWHGDTLWAITALEIIARGDVDTVVQVGDFGYFPRIPDSQKYIETLNQVAVEEDIHILWVKGNHEDHEALTSLELDKNGLGIVASNIHFIPPGFRWTWAGKVWVGLGGAVSVDRENRTAGMDWFSNEGVSLRDFIKATDPGRADVMITHDAPIGVDIPGPDRKGNDSGWPKSDILANYTHREMIQSVVDIVGPEHLWHGHYHVRYDEGIVGGTGHTTTVHGLDKNRTAWEDNIVFVDTETLTPVP